MRRVPLALVIVVASLLLAPSAASGGGSWLNGPDDVAVGQTVTLRGTFGDGALAPVSAGPWFGYLAHDYELVGPGEPVFLGAVDIRPSETIYCCWVASLTFTVPDVPAGSYWVRVCDMGCHTGVGDLIGAEVFVAVTAAEARLSHALRDARARLETTKSRAEVLRRRGTALEDRVELLEHEVSNAEVKIGALERSRDGVAAELAAEREQANAQRRIVMVLAVVLLLVIVVAGWAIHARRRTNRPAARSEIVTTDDVAVPDPDRKLALRR
jgi:hypothetical protein